MAIIRQNFDGAQTFFIDPKFAADSRTVAISSVDLFFKFKPDPFSLTGQPQPGVTLFIVPTKYGVPNITRESGIFTGVGITRVNLRDIITSSDATQPTKFEFPDPVTLRTDQEYAFVYSFDLNSEFTLWKSKAGEVLVQNENRRSPGPSNQFIGSYFGFTSLFVAEDDDANLDDYIRNWRAESDTAVKFNINAARYAVDGVPVENANTGKKIYSTTSGRGEPTSSNSSHLEYDIRINAFEYISFDENESAKAEFVGGQLAYQNTVFYPGGYYGDTNTHISLTMERGNNHIAANSEYPNGAAFSWEDIFTDTNHRRYVVLVNAAETKTNVRRIRSIISNTVAELVEPPTFTSSGKMMITPTGLTQQFHKDSLFDREDSFVFLSHSTANSTVRFTNNTVEAANLDAGGTGYSNGDVLYVTGYEQVTNMVEGGYVAVANLVTNSTGGVTQLHFSNLGCGFVNSAAILPTVANSTQLSNTTGNTSSGSGLTLSYTIGSTIKTEYGNNVFKNTVPVNIDLGDFVPFYNIDVPPGVSYTERFKTNYYKEANTSTLLGEAYWVRTNPTDRRMIPGELNRTQQYGVPPVLMSKSNEFHIKYKNGNANDRIPNTATSYSNSVLVNMVFNYSSDYSQPRMSMPFFQFSKYIVNDDATDEHTDSGNAIARHLTTVIPFERPAEDLRLYLTAYRPANTEIKAYARIHRSEDDESFDDKNWTELEMIDGSLLESSSIDEDDYVELTYGIYSVPKDRTTLDGTVEVTNNSSVITGSGTDFSTDLSVGDVVYMYQPLFPNNYIIASVTTVTNTTSIIIDESTTNNSLHDDGMIIEKITYPKQAFLNPLNDNVVRYYNSNFQKYDSYDSMAIKLVYLANNANKVPRVDDMKVIGVSA